MRPPVDGLGLRPGSICAALCEPHHIRFLASALPLMRTGGSDHDDATDGILVVQIRRFRTISGEVSVLAARDAAVTVGGERLRQ